MPHQDIPLASAAPFARCLHDCSSVFLARPRRYKGTYTKLHKDTGGLAITISALIGEKECILVHRNDAALLYRGQADLENPNLQQYPMLAFARVWRHVLRPGEILFLPQGTFHACRNLKPCLSYSRFHLDQDNLPAFLTSYLDGDAVEIDHGEILWNATYELIKSLDQATDRARRQRFSQGFQGVQNSNSQVRRPWQPYYDHGTAAAGGAVVGMDRGRPSTGGTGGTGGTGTKETVQMSYRHQRQTESLWALRHVLRSLSLRGPAAQRVHAWDILVADVDICLQELHTAHNLEPFHSELGTGAGMGKQSSQSGKGVKGRCKQSKSGRWNGHSSSSKNQSGLEAGAQDNDDDIMTASLSSDGVGIGSGVGGGGGGSDSEDDGEDGAAVAEDFGPYQQRAVPVSAIINHTKEVVFKVR